MRNFLLALSLLLILAGCGAGSPSGPVMLPTTVEYMGETVGGDVAVQTGKTADFVAKDANGNIVDPSSLTVEIVDNSGAVLDYGTAAIVDNQLQIVQPSYFPNTESQYVANFYSGDTLLSTSKSTDSAPLASFPIKVSVSEDDFQFGNYTITDPMLVFNETETSSINLSLTGNNILYACYRADYWNEEHSSLTGNSMIVSKKTDADSLIWSGPYTAIHYDFSESPIAVGPACSVTSMDSATPGTQTVAVAWVVNDLASNSDCGIPFGCRYYYHYVAFSNNSGQSFSAPLLIKRINMIDDSHKNPDTVAIIFDSAGLLHTVFISSDSGDTQDLFYSACTQQSCETPVRVNTVLDSVSGQTFTIPLDVSLNEATGIATIYTSWVDNRDSQPITIWGAPWNSLDIYMSKIVRSGGTVQVSNETKVNTSTGVFTPESNLMIDREGNPVVTWSQITPTGTYTTDYDIYMRKSYDNLASLRNQISLSDMDPSLYYVAESKLAADASNYYHLSYAYLAYDPVTGQPVPNTLGLRYTMGKYSQSADGNDTFSSLPSKNILSDLDISTMSSIDSISDSAGRAYLMWTDISSGDAIKAIEGNIQILGN